MTPMPSPDAELIRTAASRVDFDSFRPIISDRVAIPEAQAVLEDIGAWYDAHPSATALDWSAFMGWARVARRARAPRW